MEDEQEDADDVCMALVEQTLFSEFMVARNRRTAVVVEVGG